MDVVDADVFQAECLQLRGEHSAALELAEASLLAAARLAEQPAQAPLLYG